MMVYLISKKRRLNNRIAMKEVYSIYCTCKLPEPEDGSQIVQCNQCLEWYVFN